MRETGLETAYVGKWHLASNAQKGLNYMTGPVPAERCGGYRDYWMASDVLEFTSHGYNGYVYDGRGKKHEFIGYRADCINNYAIDYLHQRDPEHPFFLFVSQIEPHHQNDRNRFEGPDGSRRRFGNYIVPGDLEGTQGDWRENYPDYLGQCASLDENVGRLIDTLRDRGEWENTVFVYTSDHGSHFRTRNSEYKRSCHDSCIHIPLIFCGPGFAGGGVRKEMVSLLDLPATLLDCAGIPKPDHFAGHSLCRLVRGDISAWPESVFIQISESQVGRAVRTALWKYAVRADADGWNASSADVYYEDFLYDLQKDPHERHNLVADPAYADVRRQLAELLIRHMETAGEQKPQIVPYTLMPSHMRQAEE